MLLAIDVGNTHTVLGVFNEDRLVAHWRIRTNGITHQRRAFGAVQQPFRHKPGGHGQHRGRHHRQRGAALNDTVDELCRAILI
jgi:uncharacterized protein (DUF1786 family)